MPIFQKTNSMTIITKLHETSLFTKHETSLFTTSRYRSTRNKTVPNMQKKNEQYGQKKEQYALKTHKPTVMVCVST